MDVVVLARSIVDGRDLDASEWIAAVNSETNVGESVRIEPKRGSSCGSTAAWMAPGRQARPRNLGALHARPAIRPPPDAGPLNASSWREALDGLGWALLGPRLRWPGGSGPTLIKD